MEFVTQSRDSGVFFTARPDSLASLSEADLSEVLHEMLVQVITASSHRVKSVGLALEVCCDTGRLILAVCEYTSDKTRLPHVGCSVRLPKLQDFWYDLDESGASADMFSIEVTSCVQRVGSIFLSVSMNRRTLICSTLGVDSFWLLVFGSNARPVASEIIRNENGA